MSETTANEVPNPDAEQAKIDKAAQSLAARHGGELSALKVVLGENYGYREEARQLKTKLPPDGSRVLTPEEAKEFDKYRGFGSPTDFGKAISERDTFAKENQGFRHTQILDEAARLADFNPSVLKDLARDVAVEIVEEKGKDGKTVRVPKVKDTNGELVSLVDHASTHWGHHDASLKAKPQAVERPRSPIPGRELVRTPPPTPNAGESAQVDTQRSIYASTF